MGAFHDLSASPTGCEAPLRRCADSDKWYFTKRADRGQRTALDIELASVLFFTAVSVHGNRRCKHKACGHMSACAALHTQTHTHKKFSKMSSGSPSISHVGRIFDHIYTHTILETGGEKKHRAARTERPQQPHYDTYRGERMCGIQCHY